LERTNNIGLYSALILANAIYAFEPVFVKLAALQEAFSFTYFVYMACAVGVLGIYAVIWQQIIKRTEISRAYMFKGTVLIFVLILSVLLFGEKITLPNIIGATMIVCGIVLFSKL